MTHDDDTVVAALKAMDRRRAGTSRTSQDDVALERLHAQIMAGAELVLRARRARIAFGRRRGMLEVAGVWSHALLPIGVAASFVAGIVLTRVDSSAITEPAMTITEATAETPVTLFAAATGSARATQLLESAVGSTSPEAVLYQAVPQ